MHYSQTDFSTQRPNCFLFLDFHYELGHSSYSLDFQLDFWAIALEFDKHSSLRQGLNSIVTLVLTGQSIRPSCIIVPTYDKRKCFIYS